MDLYNLLEYSYEKVDSEWHFCHESISNLKKFKDEPHFQYTILHNSIPLYFQDKWFYPICTEFPASPGIDLIYLNKDAGLIIVEMKNHSYSSTILINESLFKFKKYEHCTVSELIKYAKSNNNETTSKALESIKAWCNKNNYSNTTFTELFENNKLEICSLVFGEPKPQLIKKASSPLHLFGLSISDTNNFHVTQYSYSPTLLSKREQICNIYTAYNQYKNHIKSQNSNRTRHDIKDIPAFINKEWKNSFCYYILKELESSNLTYTIGTGTSLSFLGRIVDQSGKSRTIIRFKSKSIIQIPGNLFNQQKYLGLNESTLSKYFDSIVSLFPNKVCKFAGTTLEVTIKSEELTVNKKVIDTFIEKTKTLIEQIRTTHQLEDKNEPN